MRVWAVANQKGGVGKTTSVVSLGALLAAKGHRVLVFDLDPQGSLTSYFGHNPDAMEHSAYDLFMHKGKIPDALPAQLIKETRIKGLQLMPASTALATLERNIAQQDGMGLIVSKTLANLFDEFDYAIIDTPPILGVLMINALAACQRLILPVQTEYMAIKGLERMVQTLKMVMQSRHQSLDYTVVPTMFDRRTQASNRSLRMLRTQYPDQIWHSAIPVDTRFRDASREGVSIMHLDPSARGSRAYQALLKSMLENE